MDFLQSVVLGMVEGFTEFLPISSTAHLILTAKILNIPQSDFVKSFEIAVQLGAILAVVWLYWRKFFLDKESLKRVIAAFLPTVFVGLFFYKIFKEYLLENLVIIVWALFLGGIFLIVFELFHKEKEDAVDDISKIPYKKSVLIGVFQSLAIVPGVSRAAATILGGLALGLKRKTIVEFSFLLAVPTMIGATGYDLLKSGNGFSPDQFSILFAGFLVSFFVAIFAIKFLLHYIQRNNFIWFGVYRIVIGLLFILFLI